jgi:hypothetical protein
MIENRRFKERGSPSPAHSEDAPGIGGTFRKPTASRKEVNAGTCDGSLLLRVEDANEMSEDLYR